MTFQFSNLKWGISERQDGAMNVKLPNSNPEHLKNRGIFFDKSDIKKTVAIELVHGNEVEIVSANHSNQIIPNKDGLITNAPDLFLTVTVADCVPIYYFDQSKNVIGIAHSGWRGTVQNISKIIIEKMISEFDSDPKNIFAHIGPHIQKCHFEIKEDIIENFAPEFIIKDQNSFKVDLLSMIKTQLTSLGLDKNNISSSTDCTYCNPAKYFSYRRDKSAKIESMVAYIGLI